MSVPWLVVSPHCDDAVLACGALLATHPGSVVVTVFAGTPQRYEPFTEWDRACGYGPGDDVMAARRVEDACALRILGCTPVWLSFLDSQYGQTPQVHQVAQELGAAIRERRPRALAFPLGLFHSDHVLVRDAVLSLVAHEPLPAACCYDDALYRRLAGAVDDAAAAIERRGFRLRAFDIPCADEAQQLKRAAIECYASQLKALATPGRLGHLDAHAPERYRELCMAGEVA